jgi:hypothetical protein
MSLVTISNGSFNIINGSVSIGTTPGGSIVTTNLTHHFDAGSAASYPGSGTVWTNLAGSRNLALVNTPTFISNGAASTFVFDGVDDFASGSGYVSGSAAKSHTLSFIGSFSDTTAFTRRRFFTATGASPSYGVEREATNLGPGRVIISQGTVDFNAIVYNETGTTQFISQSQTGMFTFVSSNTGIDFYLNGSLLGGTTANTFLSGFGNVDTTFSWASDAGGTTPISMSISHIMFYSASLTPTEILQNYNALKSRYGI